MNDLESQDSAGPDVVEWSKHHGDMEQDTHLGDKLTPLLFQEGFSIDHGGNLISTWYLDFRMTDERSPIGAVIKYGHKQSAIERSHTIRLAQPPSYRQEGETLIYDKNEGLVTKETVVEREVPISAVEHARTQSLNDDINRALELSGQGRLTFNTTLKRRTDTDTDRNWLAVAVAGERVRVLAVDDDPQALRYVRDALLKSGYTPVVTGDPEEALRLVGEEKPDLVLLDLMLPGTDGIELMKDILGAGDVLVIFLSAYGRDELIARAFDMGAVDYVVKPFSPTELAARIRAALRKRAASEPSEPYVLGDLTIDYAERRVTLASHPLPLIAMEYRLLAELSANAGRLLTYEHLLERVWGEKSSGDVRPMRTIVSKLRRKLGDDADNPTYIFTEPRVGYRMPKGEG